MNHFIIDYDSTFIKVESLDELSKISNGDDETINNKISEIKTFPKRENSSNNIF